MTQSCTHCNRELPLDQFHVKFWNRKGPFSPCRSCLASLNEQAKTNPAERLRRRQSVERAEWNLRAAAFAAYGARCACCGEDERQFLVFHRPPGHGNDGRKFLRELKKERWPAGGATVYCRNCAYSIEQGQKCPHQRSLSKAAVH